jgi:hypothetical protein
MPVLLIEQQRIVPWPLYLLLERANRPFLPAYASNPSTETRQNPDRLPVGRGA